MNSQRLLSALTLVVGFANPSCGTTDPETKLCVESALVCETETPLAGDPPADDTRSGSALPAPGVRASTDLNDMLDDYRKLSSAGLCTAANTLFLFDIDDTLVKSSHFASGEPFTQADVPEIFKELRAEGLTIFMLTARPALGQDASGRSTFFYKSTVDGLAKKGLLTGKTSFYGVAADGALKKSGKLRSLGPCLSNPGGSTPRWPTSLMWPSITDTKILDVTYLVNNTIINTNCNKGETAVRFLTTMDPKNRFNCVLFADDHDENAKDVFTLVSQLKRTQVFTYAYSHAG